MSDQRGLPRPGPKWVLAVSSALLAGGIAVLLLGDSAALDVGAALLCGAAWVLPAMLIVRRHARGGVATRQDVRAAQSAARTDVRAAQSAIVKSTVSAVEQSRAKQSRHEYHQERSLDRIEMELRRLSASIAQEPLAMRGSGIDVLFVTSNGAGLGHVSRLLAIAGHLPSTRTVELLTLSTAYRQVAREGLRVHYFPSSEAAEQPPDSWNGVFRGYFRGLVERTRPRVVVFDGTWVYTGLTDVCRALGIPLVWVQRGMWKEEIDAASPQRHAVRSVADEVIIPGDFAGDEDIDVGPGIRPRHVGPILMTSREDLLDRDQACLELGLDPAGRYVLLNLGGGSVSDPDSIAHAALECLLEHFPEATPVQVVSPLADPVDDVAGLRRISAYPIMNSIRAFDIMIAAAGYNTAQEAVALGTPSILIPNSTTRTDDQVRRARDLAERGLCLVAEDADQLEQSVRAMARGDVRREILDRLATVDPPRGARDAAVELEEIYSRSAWTSRTDTVG